MISKLFPADPSLFLSSNFRNLFARRYKDHISCSILIILVRDGAKNFKCSCNNRRSSSPSDPRNVFVYLYWVATTTDPTHSGCDWERINNAMAPNVDPGNENWPHHLRFWPGWTLFLYFTNYNPQKWIKRKVPICLWRACWRLHRENQHEKPLQRFIHASRYVCIQLFIHFP